MERESERSFLQGLKPVLSGRDSPGLKSRPPKEGRMGHRGTEDTEDREVELKSRPPEKGGISHRGRERFFHSATRRPKGGRRKKPGRYGQNDNEDRVRMTAGAENR